MGHLQQPARPAARPAWQWRRRRHRRWIRTDDLPSATRLFSAIPSLPRATLSRLTDRLIDRMDELDGDPDGDGRDAGWPEWHQLPSVFQRHGLTREDALALEDDEDTHDAEQEQAHD